MFDPEESFFILETLQVAGSNYKYTKVNNVFVSLNNSCTAFNRVLVTRPLGNVGSAFYTLLAVAAVA